MVFLKFKLSITWFFITLEGLMREEWFESGKND